MVEAGRRTGLALEALDEVRVVAVAIGQHLDRDFAVQRLVLRQEHARHPALAEAADDAVAAGEERALRGVHRCRHAVFRADCLTMPAP